MTVFFETIIGILLGLALVAGAFLIFQAGIRIIASLIGQAIHRQTP